MTQKRNAMSGEFTSGYLREVTGDLDAPCAVCGAIIIPC